MAQAEIAVHANIKIAGIVVRGFSAESDIKWELLDAL